MVRLVDTMRTPKFRWNGSCLPPKSSMKYSAVVYSLMTNELRLSLKNFSVLFGTPAPAHTDCRKVDGLVMPPVNGFLTMILPAPKLLVVSARPGFDTAVEYGIFGVP